MRTAAFLASFFLLCVAPGARAQVCPDGAEGRPLPDEAPSANGYCAPLRCNSDAACRDGAHCTPMAMCIGALPTPSGRPTETAWHPCGAHDACNDGEHCDHARYCSRTAAGLPVAPAAPPPPVAPAAPPPRTPGPPSVLAPAHDTVSPFPTNAPEPAHGTFGCTVGGGTTSVGAAALFGLVALLASAGRPRRR